MQHKNQAPRPQMAPIVPEFIVVEPAHTEAMPTAPMPTPVEVAPAVPPAKPIYTPMEGWFRDLTVTGDRRPIRENAQVTQRWGLPWGKEMGKIILPGRDRPGYLPVDKDPDLTLPYQPIDVDGIAEDQSMRTLHIFDARIDPGEPPHYIVASRTALKKIAKLPPLFRGVAAKLSRDVHHIYEGQRLEVGAKEGRWLPGLLKRREKKIQSMAPGQHQSRRVISGEQTMFYVGEDHQLHVRSEGRNADTLLAHPSDAENAQRFKQAAYERDMEERIRKANATKAQHMRLAPTEHLRMHQPTTYISQNAGKTETLV